jgi:hypothetical protein
MKSLRCVCGRVLTAGNGESLFAEVERHLDEVLIHARLIERDSDRETQREKSIGLETKEER